MAITAEQRNDVISLLVGMFDAAPSAALMTGFVASIEGGASTGSIANDMDDTTEFQSLYPVWLTDAEFSTRFATNILDGNTSAAALQVGIDYVSGRLADGVSRGDVASEAAAFLNDAATLADADFGTAAQAFQNKVEVAEYFATTKLDASSDFDSLQAVVAGIDETSASVTAKKILIDADIDSLSQSLTNGVDNLTGSAGNDMFTGWIFDNSNSAESGDQISGGLGSDTLMAEIGNSQNFAISLKTDSVETVYFRAQADSTDSSDNDIQDGGTDGIDEGVQIDAQDMNGTTAFWSTESRSSLTIEDVRNNSNETTLGWQNADAGSVNFEVYYDTPHITAPGGTTSGSQLYLELMDLEGMENNSAPLEDNPYVGVSFTMDGVTVQVPDDTAGVVPVAGTAATYSDLVDAINALLTAQGLTTVSASLGDNFSAIHSTSGITYTGTQIVLTNTGSETLGTGGWVAAGPLPGDSNLHTQQSTVAPTTSSFLTQTDIIFDDVGRGSKAGDFVAGNISQGTVSGSKGIQQFNIQIDGDSWVDTVRSTNNTLEEVFLESIGDEGTIRIDDLNDVKVFDATSMTNDVTLTANLDDAVIGKFLDLQDDAPAVPATDNDTFAYTTSSGDDSMTLTASREAAAHEDFALSVDGGSGADTISVELTNGVAVHLDNNWYADQHTLSNVTINGGSGDDTITTTGTGDATINGGTGNDTVYTDNSGVQAGLTLVGATSSKAAWVFNADALAADKDITDLAGAALVETWLHDATVVVTFSGATVGGGVTLGTAAENDQGFESTAIEIPVTNYLGTQANVNQAIKSAINDDAVLSKLLVATDGPDNTLVVTSLIDGTFAADDLLVDVKAATWADYSASEQTTLNSAYDLWLKDSDTAALSQVTLDGFVTAVEGAATTGYAAAILAQDAAAADITGAASTAMSDNVVDLGTGSDVVVLGTEAAVDAVNPWSLTAAEELAASNDTIVVKDTSFGTNTIVNFNDGSVALDDAGVDYLDFTDILNTVVRTSASNSTASQAVAAVNYDGDATFEVNEVSVTTFTAAGTDTWAGLTAAELLDALNGDGDYADIADADGASDNGAGRYGTDDTDIAETSQDHLLLVENTANDGEYKVFKLTSVSDAAAAVDTGDFATAELLGTLDFGDALTFNAGQFV